MAGHTIEVRGSGSAAPRMVQDDRTSTLGHDYSLFTQITKVCPSPTASRAGQYNLVNLFTISSLQISFLRQDIC